MASNGARDLQRDVVLVETASFEYRMRFELFDKDDERRDISLVSLEFNELKAWIACSSASKGLGVAAAMADSKHHGRRGPRHRGALGSSGV